MWAKSKQQNLLLSALALSLSTTVSLGFARFNYALLLPAMHQDLAWTYSQAGSMNTVNAMGYLIGALVSAPLAKSFGLFKVFQVGFIITALCLLFSGFSDEFTVLLALRLIVGISGAVIFIVGASFASHLAGKGKMGLVFGIYFGGVGLGILLAGVGLPQLIDNKPEIWRIAWIVMGLMGLLAAHFSLAVARNIHLPDVKQTENKRLAFPYDLLPSLSAYFMFGLGYITYMTFIIAYLRSNALDADMISGFWLLFGVCTFSSAFVWRRVLDNAKNAYGLVAVLSAVTIGSALPLFSVSWLSLITSAVLFGGSFLSVVAMVMTIARRSLAPHFWTAGIALYTIFFSLGQIAGPLISGVLADRTQSLTNGFMLSVGVLAMGVVFALFQKEVRLK